MDSIPFEMYEEVCRFLVPKDIIRLRQTDKKLYKFIKIKNVNVENVILNDDIIFRYPHLQVLVTPRETNFSYLLNLKLEKLCIHINERNITYFINVISKIKMSSLKEFVIVEEFEEDNIYDIYHDLSSLYHDSLLEFFKNHKLRIFSIRTLLISEIYFENNNVPDALMLKFCPNTIYMPGTYSNVVYTTDTLVPSVTRLELYNCFIAITKFNNLKYLSMDECYIDIKRLESIPSLEILDVRCSMAQRLKYIIGTGKELCVPYLPKLNIFNFQMVALAESYDMNISNIERMVNLTKLRLDIISIAPGLKLNLLNLTKLTDLYAYGRIKLTDIQDNVENIKVSEFNLDDLPKYLERVQLYVSISQKITPNTIMILSKFTKLKSLTVEGMNDTITNDIRYEISNRLPCLENIFLHPKHEYFGDPLPIYKQLDKIEVYNLNVNSDHKDYLKKIIIFIKIN